MRRLDEEDHAPCCTSPGRACRRILAFAKLLIFLLSARIASAAANESETLATPDSIHVGPHDPLPRSQTDGISLPYKYIIRDTQPPYENLFGEIRAGERVAEKVGPADIIVQGTIFGNRLSQFRPENAEFRIGRLYLDVRSFSASVLYSDNVEQDEHDRDSGVIGIVRLTSALRFQLTDNIRIGAQGTIVYLPFQNEIGIAGFGIYDPLTAFEPVPIFVTELSVDKRVGGWDLEVIDEFSSRLRRFGLEVFESDPFTEEDRAGNYAFSDRTRFRDDTARFDYNEVRNLVGASASRLLPTETELEFGVRRTDYLYYGSDNGDSLPASRETAYASLVSQRETLRFKPFLRYRATRYDQTGGWGEDLRGGIQGPITENLSMLADIGYYWRTDSENSSYLARLRLRHTPNPLTYHQLEYHRGITEPIEEIADSVTYLVHHVFREDLTGQLYGSAAKFEDSMTGNRTGEEYRGAGRLTYELARHTSLRLSGAYADFVYDDPTIGNYHEWIGRTELLFRHSASLQTRLLYQYRNRESERPDQSYWENLVILTVIKFF